MKTLSYQNNVKIKREGVFMSNVTPQTFRQTLGRFASGVTVVTMLQDGETHGITVSAFLSVSLEPPLVLVSIDKKAHSHERMMPAERYGVSILSEGQESLSNHFANRDPNVVPESEMLHDFPVLKNALAQLVCKTVQKVDAGDHTLFIGELEALAWREDAAPLVYFHGKYQKIEKM
jgi:flavin reductase (DIM6/NTAB) family NADH-FMN oxidoreductase RutF